MNLGRNYQRAKWEALTIAIGILLWLLVAFGGGCSFLPTLTHPRSRDAVDLRKPVPEMDWANDWERKRL